MKFATSYKLVDKSGNYKIFNFEKSTGPEFDPNTEWIYKSENSQITLVISNDATMTKVAAESYKTAKLSN